LLTEFQTSAFVGLVEKTTTIVDEADRKQIPKLLNALGTIDLGLIQRTLMFLKIAEDIVLQAEPRVEQQEKNRSQADPSVAAGEIISLLEGISTVVASVAEDAP
jgi:hypothetical protein